MQWVQRTATGAAVGLLTGVLAGALAGFGGAAPGVYALATVALGIPLGLMGAGYDLLLEARRFRPGGITETAFYWTAGFPLARLLQELAVNGLGGHAMRDGLVGFLTFQAVVGFLYGIGFLLLHIQVHLLLKWLCRMAGQLRSRAQGEG